MTESNSEVSKDLKKALVRLFLSLKNTLLIAKPYNYLLWKMVLLCPFPLMLSFGTVLFSLWILPFLRTNSLKHRNSLLKQLKKEICPITDLTAHIFRHNYATILYYSGISIKKAAALMGHTDTKMIMQVYAHLDDEKEQTSEKINVCIKIGLFWLHFDYTILKKVLLTTLWLQKKAKSLTYFPKQKNSKNPLI